MRKSKKEVTKYHNDLNTVSMRNWTAEEMDLFFSIITQMRDQGTKEVNFGKDELKELANSTIEHNKRFADVVENLVDKVAQIRFVEKTSNSYSLMNLFAYFKAKWSDDLSEMNLTVQATDKFQYVLNKLNAEFTQWELEEFTSIRSTYAKTVYRLLKQWRTVGRKEFKFDEFKLLLDMPDYYMPSHIDKNILAPVKKELPKYFENLRVKKIKSNKRGNPVIAYEFTWKPEQTGEWNPNKYLENEECKTTKQKYYKNGMPKPDEREYTDEEIESYYFYAVSENDSDLDTKEIDNSKIKDDFEDDEPIFGGQLEI